MSDFFRTVMGKAFIEGTMPRIKKAIEEVAVELRQSNTLRERELELKERELKLREKELDIRIKEYHCSSPQ
ncbi:hypothetical protein [Aneurinibacillus tyrosinisolvens]|uniref:hypothetical protein n=1 Tax=Aneurinibacillus tyrosinisolvens TaxID=1443435 RepID=UPI00063FA84C|nr:hypothetical protein [Aneurinibacillus tyrosinisolvens]